MIELILWILFNLACWYAFFFFLLYAIKREINLYLAALILLIIGCVGFLTCPFLQSIGKLLMHANIINRGLMGKIISGAVS